MKSRRWIVYCHIHRESGRRYVGLTSKTMLARWNDHIYKAKSSKGGRWHFPNAIRRYGKDAFDHEVLQICSSLEEANAAEQYWIWVYDTRNPLRGFNLAEGGKHIPHPIRKNPWDDPEYRKKASAMLIAVTQTPQARANNKASLNTPESKAKRSSSAKASHSRPEVKAKISLIQKAIANTPGARERRSAAVKEAWQRPGARAKLSVRSKEAMSRPEVRTKMSESMKRVWSDPDARARLSNSVRNALNDPEERTRKSLASKEAMARPDVKAKISAAATKYWIEKRPELVSRQKDSFLCRVHGPVPASECYKRQTRSGTRLVCKACMRAYNARRP